ncbi:glycosyltransferase family 4 protein [Leptothoe kymatousa]|uniref:Glycosyltransferase family 4 protein n=1 Tax=Leptothoe kymatousa TAU-MAC 1615 TaxID=2364775 RepID=A0ABS5Y3U8_9CYAN|nr:glycosyltransferase family 4 protein [Leptothoe kymatousa]MBT9312471.1 glycosyltransferase family 4 protein [Leptothoe kymatousa TAU-MAC 1615]
MLLSNRTTNKRQNSTRIQEKVLLVANTGWYLYNFRLPLLQALRERGAQVVVVSPWDKYAEKLQAEGFWWIDLDLERRSTNPFMELYTIFRLVLIYLVEKPDIVHHFTIKCVLYGTFAAKLSGIKSTVNAITGLGYIFINKSLKAKLIRFLTKPMYYIALNTKNSKVIFQNFDDLSLLVREGLADPQKSVLIRSSGVDSQRFKLNLSPENVEESTVLLASRIVGDKGIYEYIEAAKWLKAQGYNARFKLAGALYPGNPTAISQEKIADWESKGIVEWLGHVDNIEDVIAEADIVVLPSHGGEGVPKILLEASAMGKPLVATDVPGCRDVIDVGINGFLVPPKEFESLAEALETLINDGELRLKMGCLGREKVIREFNVKDIVKQTIEVYAQMGIFNNSSSVISNASSLSTAV